MPSRWRSLLILVAAVALLVAVAPSEAKRDRDAKLREERERWNRGRDRLAPHDPNFRVGRWGRYGGVSYGAQWMHHQEIRTQELDRNTGAPPLPDTGDPTTALIGTLPEDTEALGPPPKPSEPAPAEWVRDLLCVLRSPA